MKRVTLGLGWGLNFGQSCIWKDDPVVKNKESGSGFLGPTCAFTTY